MNVIQWFFSLSLEFRAALLLGTLFLTWLLIGKKILYILSIVPFLLRQLFHGLYLLIEWPIATLHKIWGGSFYRIGNQLALLGKQFDDRLAHWYQEWHHPQKQYNVLALLVYAVSLLLVILPSHFHSISPNSWLNTGETRYLRVESSLKDWIEECDWYNPDPPSPVDIETAPSITANQMSFVVNVSSTLQVRDIPSIKDATVLDSLKKGDIVIWQGQLTFGFAEDKVEPWAKVTTDAGIEGWCRLFYLQPEQQDLNLVFSINN